MPRHCQTLIQQHPLPWRRQVNSVKPQADDTTVDSAQMAVLVAQGSSLLDIAACERQPEACRKELPWAKVMLSSLWLVTKATTWWGCTALSWDLHFPSFVSPDPLDVELGATPFNRALATVGQDSVICLDAFSDDQQHIILTALGKSKCKRWVLFSSKARVKCVLRQMLLGMAT